MIRGILAAVLAVVLFPISAAQASDADVRRQERLLNTVMNDRLPLEQRITALRRRYADLLEDGKIRRTFCVWDMLGRSGPVFSTVDDQRFRSLQYGLELTLVAYQDEEQLLRDLRSGQCDAGLISGARVPEFNRFAATVEALGAVPDVTHLQTLMQALSSPRMAPAMEQGDYVVLGIASLGEHYLFTHDAGQQSLGQLRGAVLGVPAYDASLQALAADAQVQTDSGPLLAVVDRFVTGQTRAMLAPLIGYHVAGAGKAGPGTGIVRAPVSWSTIQLIGRQARFPTGLAQILREDFLVRMEQYIRRVETERANIPAAAWFPVSPERQSALETQLRELRIRLRNDGLYDARMLKLQKRVRCHLDGARMECQDGRE